MTRLRLIKRPSKREIRNALTFLDGGTAMESPKKRGGSGRQPESKVNDAVKAWARGKGGVLYRNRRGVVDMPSGGMLPFGLGPNGYGDLVGYLPVTVTPGMVGRVVAIYCMVESKTPIGSVDQQQLDRITEVRDAGGIAGVARSESDCEEIFNRWRSR